MRTPLRVMIIAALSACATVSEVGEGLEFEACCLASDTRACALELLAPGENIELVCGDYIEFPERTRWEVAEDVAGIACEGDARWWCVGELTREMCPRKLDPWCGEIVSDGRAWGACLAETEPGAIGATCARLF